MKQTFILSALVALLAACGQNTQHAATSNPDSLSGKTAYVNPVDNNTYVSEKGWKEYKPEDGVKWDPGTVQMEKIVLLTDQTILPSLINIDTLGDYINGIKEVVLKELAPVKEKGEVMIQYILYAAKKPQIRLSYKGNLEEQTLFDLKDLIGEKSKNRRTIKDSCSFQVLYSVNERIVKE